MPCFLLFSKLNEGRSGAPRNPLHYVNNSWFSNLFRFEVIRVFSAMRLHQHKHQFGVVDSFPQSCVQFSCCVTVVHTLDHLHRPLSCDGTSCMDQVARNISHVCTSATCVHHNFKYDYRMFKLSATMRRVPAERISKRTVTESW